MRGRFFLMLVGLLSAQVVQAQLHPDLPDPATINVPDVGTIDPKVQSEGYKFFYFHNPDITFADAVADIAECRSFLSKGAPPRVPGFIAWTEPVKRKVVTGPGLINAAYGPLGIGLSIGFNAALTAIIMPKMERGLRNNKLRRCMEPRGYARYPLPEASWQVLNEGDETKLILIQAKLATGPKPTTGKVEE